ncbi:MFS transporter [Neobacillus niacini]|uniref:MFS transporter n=1 Tax=Neobacillus niacini TaxID=86668 RepID=UPI00286340B5|nr:MFS transporter [Neobacillus niacini]MDR6998417.1 MFS family permease [Neobacillus niacini]
MRWVVLAILFFGFLINFADKSVVGLAAGSVMKELNLTYAQWGIIGSSFFWIFPIAAIFVGAITDKIGSKKILSYMLLAWSVLQFGGYVIAGFSTLLLYRILLGFSEGGFAPASLRQLFAYFPPNMRARATTIFTTGATVGAYAVAPLVVALIHMTGWRHTFAIMGLCSLVLFVVWTIVVPKQSPKLQEVEKESVSTPKSKFTWSEFYPILLSRTCLLTLFATFGFFCLSSWMQIWMPIYFVKVAHISEMGMAYATLLIGASSVLVSITMATISDRVFKKTQNLRMARVWVTGIGMLIGALFIGSLCFIHSPVWSVIAIALGYGLSFLIMSTSHIIMSHQLPERTSTLSGVIVAFQNIAAMICPIVTGFMIEFAGKDNVTQGFNYSFLMISLIILIISILFTIFVYPDRKMETVNLVKMEEATSGS